MRLARKLIIVVALGMFGVLALDAWLGVRSVLERAARDMRDDHATMARSVRPALRHVWAKSGPGAAQAALDATDRRMSKVDLRWVWVDGLPPALAQLARELGDTPRTVVHDGRALTLLPLTIEGQPAALLTLAESLADDDRWVRERIRAELATTLLLMLVAAAVAIAAGWLLVGRPVSALAAQARRAGSGDLGARSGLRGSDELGELSRELDEMCAQLDEARRRLVEENDARVAAVEQLRHADRLTTVGKLAAGIAHELGTPLNVIAGRARMIEEEPGTPRPAVEHAAIVGEQARRLAKVIRQLLDFARVRRGERARVDLRDVARSSLVMLAPMAQKARISLALDDGVPPCAVHADVAQLQQALANLVVNGIQATAPGGRVELRLGQLDAVPPAGIDAGPGRYARITVKDDGAGIPAESLQRIFEPFFTTKPVGEGTGLGLSVTWGIVREHGGWIDVASQPGSGTSFDLYLPGGEA